LPKVPVNPGFLLKKPLELATKTFEFCVLKIRNHIKTYIKLNYRNRILHQQKMYWKKLDKNCFQRC